jgi:hypothetical protein
MFSPTKVSFVTVQNSVIDFRRNFYLITNLKREGCPTRDGVRTAVCWPRTLWRVDALALITRRISFLKCGRPAATVNVSEFRSDTLCLCSKQRVAKCGCRLFEARQKVTPAPHELHRDKNVSWLWEVEGLVSQRVSSVLVLVLCFIVYKFGTMCQGLCQKKKKNSCRESSISTQLDRGLLFYSE